MIDYTQVAHLYLICGKTDLRKGIDGLVQLIVGKYELDPYQEALFLFCGNRKDRYKALYWDTNGFCLLYKRLEEGKLQWPTKTEEVKQLTTQQIRWLFEGLSIEPKRVNRPVTPGKLF